VEALGLEPEEHQSIRSGAYLWDIRGGVGGEGEVGTNLGQPACEHGMLKHSGLCYPQDHSLVHAVVSEAVGAREIGQNPTIIHREGHGMSANGCNGYNTIRR